MVQTRRKNYNIVNHGTGNINDEIINNSDETTLREVRMSIISALFTLYYTFDLYIFEHFTNHHFFVIIQETRPSPSCSWGMENGISYSYASLKNRCCIRIYNQLACAEDGNAQVHEMCQWTWLEREKLDMNFNRPIYCPLHNRQRGDYIQWYYETMKNEPIPESLKLTTSEDVKKSTNQRLVDK